MNVIKDIALFVLIVRSYLFISKKV